MRIDPNGRLDMWTRWDLEVLEEFGWDIQQMCAAIRELREELENKEKEIEKLQNETS